MSTETASPFDSMPEGAARTNAELVFAVISNKPKRVPELVDGLKNRYKNTEKHLSEIQVKGAVKTLAAMGLIATENVPTGVKGRPPKGYRLPAPAADTAQA